MNLDIKLFIEATESITPSPVVHGLHVSVVEWLSSVGATDSVIKYFSEHAYSRAIKYGKVTLHSAHELKSVNKETENQRLISRGLLVIGSGLNGDPIILCLKSGKVGFVSHDELWENEDNSIEDIYIFVSDTLGTFFNSATKNGGFPVDYYQAIECG